MSYDLQDFRDKYQHDVTYIKDYVEYLEKFFLASIRMIGRRNVHIHHNGIADQMYLTNFNIYRATVDDYLSISKEYFEKVVEVTKQVVASISQING